MYLDKDKEELKQKFRDSLLDTNRGYKFYVDWNNVEGLEEYEEEIKAMDELIGCKDDQFYEKFETLLKGHPKVIEIFPVLFALSKDERDGVIKGESLKIIRGEIGGSDFDNMDFKYVDGFKLSKKDIKKYYDFFDKMGLKELFSGKLFQSTHDYIIGVLVGLDTNGSKNRG